MNPQELPWRLAHAALDRRDFLFELGALLAVAALLAAAVGLWKLLREVNARLSGESLPTGRGAWKGTVLLALVLPVLLWGLRPVRSAVWDASTLAGFSGQTQPVKDAVVARVDRLSRLPVHFQYGLYAWGHAVSLGLEAVILLVLWRLARLMQGARPSRPCHEGWIVAVTALMAAGIVLAWLLLRPDLPPPVPGGTPTASDLAFHQAVRLEALAEGREPLLTFETACDARLALPWRCYLGLEALMAVLMVLGAWRLAGPGRGTLMAMPVLRPLSWLKGYALAWTGIEWIALAAGLVILDACRKACGRGRWIPGWVMLGLTALALPVYALAGERETLMAALCVAPVVEYTLMILVVTMQRPWLVEGLAKLAAEHGRASAGGRSP